MARSQAAERSQRVRRALNEVAAAPGTKEQPALGIQGEDVRKTWESKVVFLCLFMSFSY